MRCVLVSIHLHHLSSPKRIQKGGAEEISPIVNQKKPPENKKKKIIIIKIRCAVVFFLSPIFCLALMIEFERKPQWRALWMDRPLPTLFIIFPPLSLSLLCCVSWKILRNLGSFRPESLASRTLLDFGPSIDAFLMRCIQYCHNKLVTTVWQALCMAFCNFPDRSAGLFFFWRPIAFFLFGKWTVTSVRFNNLVQHWSGG